MSPFKITFILIAAIAAILLLWHPSTGNCCAQKTTPTTTELEPDVLGRVFMSPPKEPWTNPIVHGYVQRDPFGTPKFHEMPNTSDKEEQKKDN